MTRATPFQSCPFSVTKRRQQAAVRLQAAARGTRGRALCSRYAALPCDVRYHVLSFTRQHDPYTVTVGTRADYRVRQIVRRYVERALRIDVEVTATADHDCAEYALYKRTFADASRMLRKYGHMIRMRRCSTLYVDFINAMLSSRDDVA